jgi:HPt (histidine-containing phosphotransfer) domain-containing protein
MKKEDIYGVNVPKGLALVGNNKTIYLKLLKTFSNSTLHEELEAAVAAGDLEQIRAKAHALKGASGNLHLDQVYDLVRSIESDARESQAVTLESENVIALKASYQNTMESINMLLGNPDILSNI